MTEYVNRTINFSTDLLEFLDNLTQKYGVSRSRILRKILTKIKNNPALIREILIGEVL